MYIQLTHAYITAKYMRLHTCLCLYRYYESEWAPWVRYQASVSKCSANVNSMNATQEYAYIIAEYMCLHMGVNLGHS